MDFEDIKSNFFTILLLVILGACGYWAFNTMESGSSHIDNQKLETLEEENEKLKREVLDLKNENSNLVLQKEEEVTSVPSVKEVTKEEVPVVKTPTPTVSKYQSLINDLQKIVNSNIGLKKGSTGPSVGSVQKFLNIYNKTSSKVDNDYGNSTVTAVKSFQKKEGLTSDGEAGTGTIKKMISWLKSH